MRSTKLHKLQNIKTEESESQYLSIITSCFPFQGILVHCKPKGMISKNIKNNCHNESKKYQNQLRIEAIYLYTHANPTANDFKSGIEVF